MYTLHTMQAHGLQVASRAPLTVSPEALAGVPYGKKFARQGDLYFARMEAYPPDRRLWPFTHGQLAPGTTQGSRHTVDLTRVTLWLLADPGPLDGPIIEAPSGVEICHPEHAHHIYPPGLYRVTYQRAYAQELRRVLD